jgi:hypothetical protein
MQAKNELTETINAVRDIADENGTTTDTAIACAVIGALASIEVAIKDLAGAERDSAAERQQQFDDAVRTIGEILREAVGRPGSAAADLEALNAAVVTQGRQIAQTLTVLRGFNDLLAEQGRLILTVQEKLGA